MSQLATARTKSLAEMASAFTKLEELTGSIGLEVSLWDWEGELAHPCTKRFAFTEMLEEAGGQIEQACRNLATKVVKSKSAAIDHAPTGHCLISTPIYHRHCLVGAAVALFGTKEMLDQEQFACLCNRLQLDQTVTEIQAKEAIRYNADQGEDLLKVLTWTLEHLEADLAAQRELNALQANANSTYEELSLLYRVIGSVRLTEQPEDFLKLVCDDLLEVMNLSAAAAVVYARLPAIEDQLVVVSGEPGLSVDQLKALIASEVAPDFLEDDRPVVKNHFDTGEGKIQNLISVPLVNDEGIMGILVGLNKMQGEFDTVDTKLVSAVGSQAEGFLTNKRLFADLEELLMGVLHALTATIDAKDPYTSGHSQRVALISRRLAEECGFAAERVEQIYLAGLLHDIGKIGVAEAILRKAGKLTEEEYQDMQRHPVLGANILGGIRQMDQIVGWILSHHERPDGKGYPRGLKKDQIPIEGRIICLADCFDAMSSDRTYHKALPLDLAIEEILRHSGTQFDSDLVETLLSIDLEEFVREMHQPAKTVFPFRLSYEHR